MLTNCLAECTHLTITVSQIERDISRKSSFFHTPLAFDAPVRGVSVRISPPRLVRKNKNGLATRWRKKFEDIFIRFSATHERDRQTDKRTDTACRHTALMHMHRAVIIKLFTASSRCHTILVFIALQHNDARYSYSKSVCPSVRYVPVLYENGLTYCRTFFHRTVAQSL